MVVSVRWPAAVASEKCALCLGNLWQRPARQYVVPVGGAVTLYQQEFVDAPRDGGELLPREFLGSPVADGHVRAVAGVVAQTLKLQRVMHGVEESVKSRWAGLGAE